MSARRQLMRPPRTRGWWVRGRGCGANPPPGPREGSLRWGWATAPRGMRMEEPKRLEQLPTPEDPGCGNQNKKHLHFWVLQSQMVQALPGHSPWSSPCCTSPTALAISRARLKPALGHSSGSQGLRAWEYVHQSKVTREQREHPTTTSNQPPASQAARCHMLSQPSSHPDPCWGRVHQAPWLWAVGATMLASISHQDGTSCSAPSAQAAPHHPSAIPRSSPCRGHSPQGHQDTWEGLGG